MALAVLARLPVVYIMKHINQLQTIQGMRKSQYSPDLLIFNIFRKRIGGEGGKSN